MASAKCKKCNDTGVWETGNNDLPCDCGAGGGSLFNVAGVEGPKSGDWVRDNYLHNRGFGQNGSGTGEGSS